MRMGVTGRDLGRGSSTVICALGALLGHSGCAALPAPPERAAGAAPSAAAASHVAGYIVRDQAAALHDVELVGPAGFAIGEAEAAVGDASVRVDLLRWDLLEPPAASLRAAIAQDVAALLARRYPSLSTRTGATLAGSVHACGSPAPGRMAAAVAPTCHDACAAAQADACRDGCCGVEVERAAAPAGALGPRPCACTVRALVEAGGPPIGGGGGFPAALTWRDCRWVLVESCGPSSDCEGEWECV